MHFEKDDEIVLMVSNFGGMSNLELGALVDEILCQLDKDYSIHPVRVYTGPLETSLNAPAFSTSILNLTAAAKETTFSPAQMKQYLDVRTSTQWESMAGTQSKQKPRNEQFMPARAEDAPRSVDPAQDLKIDPSLLEGALRRACSNLVAAEPDLTHWDTEMGDGDCGETLKTGANAMLSAIDSGLTKSGSVVKVLHEVENILESKMGGTLGGILGIFFVALTTALQKNLGSSSGLQLWGTAVSQGLNNLQRYTPAKSGDRTVMDVLIPFAAALGQVNTFDEAVQKAVEAAEATRKMTPKLGRATYVGIEEGKKLPPDPGAWGIMVAIRGLAESMKK